MVRLVPPQSSVTATPPCLPVPGLEEPLGSLGSGAGGGLPSSGSR